MVQLGGLEPPTSGSTNRRSNQLSYNCTRGLAANSRALVRRSSRGGPYAAAMGGCALVLGKSLGPN